MYELKWTTEGENILAEETLLKIKNHLDDVDEIAVKHWHFYGGSAPTPLVFDDYDDFYSYLQTKVKVGDAIDVWCFPSDHDKRIAGGKYPNENGETPVGGAY